MRIPSAILLLAILLAPPPPAGAAERRPAADSTPPGRTPAEEGADGGSEPCRPGLGPAFDSREIGLRAGGAGALSAPRNASIEGGVDRALLCPGLDEEIPCLVRGPVLLQCARLGLPIELRHTVIRGGLDLSGALLGGGLLLSDVDILGPLSLAGASADGAVRLERVLVAGEARFDFASFGGPVAIHGLRILGPMTFQGADLAKPVVLSSIAVLRDLDLSFDSAPSIAVAGAEVGGDVLLEGVVVDGGLAIEKLRARGRLEALALTTADDFRLERVEAARGLGVSGAIGGTMTLERVVSGGDLELVDTKIGGRLLFADCRLAGEVFVAATEIGGSLELLNSEFEEGADLGDSAIAGELALVGSRFGAKVSAGRASLGRGTRVAACAPPDPLDAPLTSPGAAPRD